MHYSKISHIQRARSKIKVMSAPCIILKIEVAGVNAKVIIDVLCKSGV